jgi:hypothetical protein
MVGSVAVVRASLKRGHMLTSLLKNGWFYIVVT